MDARLVFHVDAPTPDIAEKVALGALNEARRSDLGASLKGRDLKVTWLAKSNVLEVPVQVSCETREEAYRINEKLKKLMAKHQRAAGIFRGEMGSLAVEGKSPVGKRWWEFWK